MTADDPGTFWQGRMEAKLEGIAETLRGMENGQLRRHEENKARLEHLETEMQDMREWRSYVKGVAATWSVFSSLGFTALAEWFRYLFARH
jgi:hypothetical protein